MKSKLLCSLMAGSFLLPSLLLFPQSKKLKPAAYEFTPICMLKTTPVKNQLRAGSGWAYAAASFFETELIRIGKGVHLLSPFWNIRMNYPLKAENFIRFSGAADFGPGGQAHDAVNIIREFGIVPESAYPGIPEQNGEETEAEMEAVLKGIVEAVLKGRNGRITQNWKRLVDSALDIYIGRPPGSFCCGGPFYTPRSFADSLGLNPESFIELTSFLHHPFYTKFRLEIRDNFSCGLSYNLPLNELEESIDSALTKGYSVLWEGDISDKNFSRKKGIALVPADSAGNTDEEYGLIKEKIITGKIRQEGLESHSTTHDHCMLIVGTAADQSGQKFYCAKNSWGAGDGRYGGYWYLSRPYFELKTVSVMLNKSALSPGIRDKLGIR